jgi:hypothetical protein
MVSSPGFLFKVKATDIHFTAEQCEQDEMPLLDPEVPPATQGQQPDNWTPYQDCIAFETVDFIFWHDKMSAGNANILLHLWAASLACHGDSPPFSDHQDLYDTIDATPIGGVLWQSATLMYNGPLGLFPEQVLPWMKQKYTIWFQDPCLLFKNMLQNPDFADSFDYAPYQQYDAKGSHRYQHFMSGDWAWNQAVSTIVSAYYVLVLMKTQNIIAEDPETHGAMFVPVILGSDKTTVSVGTGHIEYWPLYGSISNIHNNIRCSHGAGLVLLDFLSIPKSELPPFLLMIALNLQFSADEQHASSVQFCQFCHKLYHMSISLILEQLHPGETTPEVYCCPDMHYQCVIWGIGPYIADYPEQVLLSCIVQGWCAK